MRCQFPYLYLSKKKCCICRGAIASCGCGPLDAINHFVESHIKDPCGESGHLTVMQMVSRGMPMPTAPCRKCGEVVGFKRLERLDELRRSHGVSQSQAGTP